MRLVYTATQEPVKFGDTVTLDDGAIVTVSDFSPPHKPDSSGKVTVKYNPNDMFGREFFVGIIGAEWIEREDRQ